MSKPLPISQLGDPILRQTAQPIYQIHEDWVQSLIADMLVTMQEANGVGIAAPQVGQPYRLLIVASRPNLRYPNAPTMEPTVMINPHILNHSPEMVSDWEGCLSIPGIRGQVPRYKQIEVEYTTPDGKLQQQVLTDFVARIFQHEFDHLHGAVFLDHVEDIHNLMTDQEYLKRVVQSLGSAG